MKAGLIPMDSPNWPLAAFSVLLVLATTLVLQLIGALITLSGKLLRRGLNRINMHWIV
jgi:hypothetical protein